MRCTRCRSPRVIRFIDGFGKERLFCKDCWNSFPVNPVVLPDQKRLSEFNLQLSYKPNLFR
uniref:IS1 family transposase n=1 Tax=candidate division CPR3 bacterium TaxID=2268181 RepID=A0A7C5YR94_UNCC3